MDGSRWDWSAAGGNGTTFCKCLPDWSNFLWLQGEMVEHSASVTLDWLHFLREQIGLARLSAGGGRIG